MSPSYAITLHGTTMGTTYTVHIADPGERGSDQRFAALVQQTLDRVDGLMSTYREDSELSRLNRATAGQPVHVSPETMRVLQAAIQVARDSGGAFDPTVGPLVDAWGFGPTHPTGIPSQEQIARLRAHVGVDKLLLDAGTGTVRKTDGATRVDLSAIAKGYGVDAVVEALATAGVRQVMVEVGGEVRTVGLRAPGQPWKIGIERPEPGTRSLERTVSLEDRAMATSGNYRNFYQVDGKRFGHTIDPRTGRPVEHTAASVSVIQDTCMQADALATTLMVMGPEQGLRWARERGIAALFVVAADGGFLEQATPAFDELMQRADAGGVQ